MHAGSRFAIVAVLCGIWLLGCPATSAPAPAKTCARAYEQCVLPSGVLGVCDTVDCPEGQAAPCLVCRSQH